MRTPQEGPRVPAARAGAIVLAVLALGVASSPTRAAERLEGAEAVEACVRKNLPEESSVQEIRMRTTDRAGKERSWAGKIYWKKFEDDLSRVMLEIDEPTEMRSAGFLVVEKPDRASDMFVYLPDLEHVRRVTARTLSGPLFGTDFTLEQFQRLHGLASAGDVELGSDSMIDDNAVYVLETRPQPDSGSGFTRIVSYVSHETCVPLKVEYYEEGERLRRVLTVDLGDITREGDSYVPRRSLMKDLWNESQTEFLVEKIEIGAPIKRATFTTQHLEAHGH